MPKRARARDWLLLALALSVVGLFGYGAGGPVGAVLVVALLLACLAPRLRLQIVLARMPENVGSIRENKRAVKQAQRSGDATALRDAEQRLAMSRRYRRFHGG